ncbi:MAG: hypothetical protein IPM53_01250 [Anaerolineaceae bacterium]|nr:hypothetical protein [Anaerolineaceae bacterium]
MKKETPLSVEQTQKCLQCGAKVPPGGQCRDRFDLCLAYEYENPTTFGAVHHLTVACYMLQHNAYSRNVWLEAREMVALFIYKGTTPADVRKRNRQKLDSGQRSWRITKGEKLSEFDTIVWSHTIADVRLDNPEIYCADIKRWAITVLEDTDGLVAKLSSDEKRL